MKINKTKRILRNYIIIKSSRLGKLPRFHIGLAVSLKKRKNKPHLIRELVAEKPEGPLALAKGPNGLMVLDSKY